MTDTRRLSGILKVISALVVTLIVLAMLPRLVETPIIISMITILMYVTLTLSWNLFSGPTNYISLATAAFFGAGVYTTAVLNTKLPLPAIVLIGGVVSFTIALFIGLLTLRLKGIYFILFTFGASALLRAAIFWWETNVAGTVGRIVIGPGTQQIYYYVVGVFAATLIVSFIIRESKYGHALRGIGQNERAAAHIGINVTLLKTVTFAASAFFMGALGSVMALRWTYIDPTIAFNPLISFLPVLMAIFGGTAQFYGPILGAAIFTILQEFLITQYPYYFMLIMGSTLVLVVLFLPEGLAGIIERSKGKLSSVPRLRKVMG
jgi:branched-chain amino acid transport system permease protein